MLRGGRPDAGRTGRRGGGHQGSAGGRPVLHRPCKASHRAGMPRRIGRKAAAGRGRRNGPVADMVCRICAVAPVIPGADTKASPGGQGPCRNPCQTQIPRSVRTAAGAIRAESPEEGQVDKPAPWSARRRLSDAGQHPASFGPRANSATPVHAGFRWFHLNDNGHAQP